MKDLSGNKFNDFSELQAADLGFDQTIANIKQNDEDISGGRFIKNVKSSQLFTGQFEKSDLEAFDYVWNLYKNNNRTPVVSKLMEPAREMIKTYKGQVCPIEVMLYTSKNVESSFANKKLLEDVAEVVCMIVHEREYFIRSVEHILKVWRWEAPLNICQMAVGKLAASRKNDDDTRLLHYIYENFHYQEILNYGCFYALIFSKNYEFVLDILNIIHDLKGTDADKQIGNLFKRNFLQNFPDARNEINHEMFWDSSVYVQNLIALITGKPTGTLMGEYLSAKTKEERHRVVDKALNRILKDDRSASPYDAISVLKMAHAESISEQLLVSLGIHSPKERQISRNLRTIIIRSYFGLVNYPPAIKTFQEINRGYEHYAAVRLALFFHNKISSETLIEDFLSEVRPDQVTVYIDGFYGFNEKDPELRMSILNYFNKDLNEEKLSVAIANYHKFVHKYRRRVFDHQIGDWIKKQCFGYETYLETSPLKIQDQIACLNIIDYIIDDYNFRLYQDFLYYVAEEGLDFSASVSNLAKQILLKIRILAPH